MGKSNGYLYSCHQSFEPDTEDVLAILSYFSMLNDVFANQLLQTGLAQHLWSELIARAFELEMISVIDEDFRLQCSMEHLFMVHMGAKRPQI